MKMISTFKPIAFVIFVALFFACEDKINPKLEQADPVLVVDAWINNKAEQQVIFLAKTQPYFDNTNPPGVSGAVVNVTDDKGKVYTFIEDADKIGNYVWMPVDGEVFGDVGNGYILTVSFEGETFQSLSYMAPVPPIDSITFKEDKEIGTNKKIYVGDFWSTDIEGPGNTYWIRAWKNGTLLNKPSEINIAFDAGFSAGSALDGVTFIPPIREGINAIDTDENKNSLSPLSPGDSINVQINSITLEAFNHLSEVVTQTNRPGGFGELFTTSLANVSTNIFNTNEKGSKVVGFFNVAAVSTMGKRFVIK